ncbi:hypothetical protein ACWDUL_10805 [Nocardia niigatensis]|uniref:hypothetical protein n=1 Tax=Nocardia niigatensis TaxID=209249 RepID=UPI0002D44866|nr:hypothetical protein [Nocardia niigatensis]
MIEPTPTAATERIARPEQRHDRDERPRPASEHRAEEQPMDAPVPRSRKPTPLLELVGVAGDPATDNTTRTYAATWRWFADWCVETGHTALPQQPRSLREQPRHRPTSSPSRRVAAPTKAGSRGHASR